MWSARARRYPPSRPAAPVPPDVVIHEWYCQTMTSLKQLTLKIFPGTSNARPPPTTNLPQEPPTISLPQELIDMVISYLAYDTRTLLACSKTCHSWYIAAAPHLHYSLTTYNKANSRQNRKYGWPAPLRTSYKLGLLPFVKRLRIRQDDEYFTPEWLGNSTFRYFSALTSLQELQMQYLQVSSFMPNVRQYFGHFAPTLRSLSLLQPKGPYRHILYFIGLFPNLQDLKLYRPLTEEGETTALAPLSTPPLRGALWLTYCDGEAFIEGMTEFFGGLHFRHIYLFEVKCAELVLESCAETAETVRQYPVDYRRPQPNPPSVRR